MSLQPEQLDPAHPENLSTTYIVAYKPGREYEPASLQAIADFFQNNFPHELYPPEVENQQLGHHRDSAQIQGQLDEGATWLTSTDAEGQITSILRMSERAPGQHHVFWLITSADHRREGAGSELLRQARDMVASSDPHSCLTASIHHENEASLRMFTDLGYVPFSAAHRASLDVNYDAPYFQNFVYELPQEHRPIAVVTGASSGFGEDIVRRLAERDWLTIAIARREDRLAKLAAEVEGEYYACDVTDARQVNSAARKILGRHTAVNLLVNSAGEPMRERIVEAHPEAMLGVIDTNYLGGIRMVRALRAGLEAASPADVVDVVSAAAGIDNPHSGPYSVSKKAQLGASRVLRSDLGKRGIAVHSVLPGKADTEGHPQAPSGSLFSKLTRTDIESVTDAVLGRIGANPAEIYVPRLLKAVSVAYSLAPVTTGRIVSKVLS